MLRPIRTRRGNIFARRQTNWPRRLAAAGIVLFALWLVGFVNFAITNGRMDAPAPPANERLGIVVLTGSPDRLQWGMDALTDGRGERLLISGVNEITRRDELQQIVSDPSGLFECCVDLGYTARNTIANADEAAAWAEEHDFAGLWVVTSYYHMPRTLLEFRHRSPALHVYPLRVEPDGYSANNWWYPGTFRILAWEYTKYEVALMRIRIASLFGF